MFLFLFAHMLFPPGVSAKAPTEVVCRVELDRSVLPADTVETAVVKVTLDAPPPLRKSERPPVNLSIVLDRSGSMSGAKLERAKDAAIEALRRLSAQDMFSLVVYDHGVDTIIPAQSAANTEWIEARIRGIHSGGNTALFAGVSQGAAEVRKNLEGRYVHRIILLSDGLANVGPSSPNDLGRLGSALVKENISVTTVGVGTDYNEDLMTRLAQNSDGNTYFVEDSRDLPRIFAAELGDVLSVVARKVILEIECPDGTQPVRIIGRDGRIIDNKVEIQLNQLYGGQEKYALVEVRVPATGAEKVRDIALANCRYDNIITRKSGSSSARVQARFSPVEREVNESANVEVKQEVILNRVAELKDEVVDDYRAGRKSQALGKLRGLSSRIKRDEARYNLGQSVAEVGVDLDMEIEELESVDSLEPARSKAYRAESYQIRTQQKAK